jgi:hypothetical protein
MNLPTLSSAQLAWLASAVATHIREQREKHASQAAPLTSRQKQGLSTFFPTRVLDQVRVQQLPSGRFVENPAFYDELLRLGFGARMLPDSRNMAAVTFVDVVVSHGFMSKRTLFHELVHVVQFWKMGLDAFAARYVAGFLSGGGYDGIPLERNAYELDARYTAERAQSFDVADEVQAWIDTGRF